MARTQQPLIYIVDNNKSYQKVVEGCLNAMGMSNIKAFDDGELCYSSGEEPADLIILDFFFGDDNWSGIEFMDEYSRLYPSTKFIFLSSNISLEIAVESIRKGALDYILKSKLGLARLAKQVEGVRQFHSNKVNDLTIRKYILGAIIMVSTLTAAMSFIYSMG